MTSDLITPRHGSGICPVCFNFTREAAGRCRACQASEAHLAAVVPISWAPANGSLHRALADYKRAAEPAVPYLIESLARLLSEFLRLHETCVAAAAGVERFDSVVVVPSSDAARDAQHPLRRIVASLVPETAGRYRDVLRASGVRCVPHSFDPRRFDAAGPAGAGSSVLLIDDVWTTGASAQSAAAVLREAGAARVAAVVIGRYVNGHWGQIDERLAAMAPRFSAGSCAVCRLDKSTTADRAASSEPSQPAKAGMAR